MNLSDHVQPQRPVTIMQHRPGVNVGMTERWVSGVMGFLLMAFGVSRASLQGIFCALGGGYFLYRGMSGHCPAYAAANVNTAQATASGEVKLKTTVTVNKPIAEVYRFWRNLENLPTFMPHLYAVTVQDDKHSHWCVKAASGVMLEWDAEIISEQENQMLAWRSLPGATVSNMGVVQFREAPGGRGTEVKVNISYDLPAGVLGNIFAPLLNKVATMQVKDDMRRFKQMMETGETVSVQGQPSGRKSDNDVPARPQRLTIARDRDTVDLEKKRFGRRNNRDLVEEMSMESFPASDPPATW